MVSHSLDPSGKLGSSGAYYEGRIREMGDQKQRRFKGKTPGRELLSRLLRNPAPTAAQIAEEITRVLRRNEESRIYHWYAATQTYPPGQLHFKLYLR
jgi:hypothetical protein